MTLAAQVPNGFVSLLSLRDSTRPLLIFAGKADDPALETQIRTLKDHTTEAAERQVLAIAVPVAGPSPTAAHLTTAEAAAARNRFHVAPEGFTVILLGKDGGEKLRSRHPLPMVDLNRTIDSMPMRHEEMRRGLK